VADFRIEVGGYLFPVEAPSLEIASKAADEMAAWLTNNPRPDPNVPQVPNEGGGDPWLY
jgi:hypothetical protein